MNKKCNNIMCRQYQENKNTNCKMFDNKELVLCPSYNVIGEILRLQAEIKRLRKELNKKD